MKSLKQRNMKAFGLNSSVKMKSSLDTRSNGSSKKVRSGSRKRSRSPGTAVKEILKLKREIKELRESQ